MAEDVEERGRLPNTQKTVEDTEDAEGTEGLGRCGSRFTATEDRERLLKVQKT